MLYTILGALSVFAVIWLLVRSMERSLDMESRFWQESTRLAIADRRKRRR
jgi:hypothetical protein